MHKLLLIYVALLSLRRLEFLPVLSYLGPIIHLTEVVFLIVAPLAVWRVGKGLLPRPALFLLGASAYLLILTLATVRVGHPQGYFELLGRYYLFAVYLLFHWAVRHYGLPFLRAVFRWWYYGAAALVFLAYLGFPLAFLGWEGLVWVYEDYPYFGTVYRASAAAGGATALILLVFIPFFYDYWRWRTEGRRPVFMLICLPLMLLTLSKEVLLIPIVLLLTERALTGWRVWHYAVALTLFLGYNLSTHYLLQPPGDIDGTIFTRAEYSPGKVAYRNDRFQLLETTYVSLKRTALWQAARHPLIGLGADQFQQRLQDDRPLAVYPAHLPPYGPHCTWTGTLAESGWLGLGALLVMVFSLVRKLRYNLRDNSSPAYALNYCLLAYWILLGLASVNGDFLHLQYVWVPCALVLGQVGANWQTDV